MPRSTIIIGVFLFPEFETLDVFGPLEVFGQLPKPYKIKLLGSRTGSVKSAHGQKLLIDEHIMDTDVPNWLFIPGGIGSREVCANEELIGQLKKLGQHADRLISVCTGSAILAKTGLLNGVKATSNKNAFDWVTTQGPMVDWVYSARWVKDGNAYTSSGVSAGIDMALDVVRQEVGNEFARQIATNMEYIWNDDAQHDPFAV